MNLNRLLILSTASVMVAALPFVSHAAVRSMSQPTSATIVANQPTMAQTSPVALFTGTFMAGEAPTTGTARIVTEGGHRYLELDSAFSTSNQGPDLHVLLDSAERPPQAYQNLGEPINLGSLHDYTGAQRYPIPDSVSLDSYKTVVIWCRMANATFGYAPLHSATNASR
ncbi:MAG TPA: DM13 domain-containing protein [Crinalium sp.]|jgi:hypothetical protein